ncbi:unnamed protein product [Tilletia caries]|nr:unnamed protein product [Tilletia caries]
MQQRNVVHADEAKNDDKVAPSLFSHASTRKKGSWKANDNKPSGKRKVLDIRPASSITITNENGHVVEASEPEDQ